MNRRRTLLLMRHAKSDWDDAGARDFDRGLNARGRRGATLMGRHIADQNIAWDAVLASPAERVRLTLEASRLRPTPLYDQRAYLADSETLMELLRALGNDNRCVLLAGHNPGLHELLFRLVDPDRETSLFTQASDKFPTAAFALIELAIDDWAEIAPGCGKLTHFMRPRDLDPALGPERAH